MNTIDSAKTVLAEVAPSVEVQGFLDAAALVDVYPTDNGFSWANSVESLQTMIAAMVAVVNPVVPTSCAALHSGNETWKCVYPSYRMPMLAVPFFVTWPQFDAFQLGNLLDNYVPSTPQQLAFVDSYQETVLSTLGSLPQGTGIFSTTCFVHCLTGHR